MMSFNDPTTEMTQRQRREEETYIKFPRNMLQCTHIYVKLPCEWQKEAARGLQS